MDEILYLFFRLLSLSLMLFCLLAMLFRVAASILHVYEQAIKAEEAVDDTYILRTQRGYSSVG